MIAAGLWWSLAWAADPVLQVVAEPPSLLVGQTGTLHVMVIVEGGANVSLASGRTPNVPIADGLGLRYRGTSQRFSAAGARIVSVFGYQYSLDALSAGVWTVGPVSVTLSDGTVLDAKPISIDVQARGAATAGPSSSPFEVRAGFDKTSAWEGELVLYEYALETTQPGVRASWRLPSFEGLRAPQSGDPEERTYQVQDGPLVITTVEGVVPLIATGVGTIEIKPALAAVESFANTDGFGGWRPRQDERRATEPQRLEVRRLPPAPPNFSGVVGDVVVEARLERDRAAVGESVGLMVSVQSDGSIEGLKLPNLDTPGFSIYDDVEQVGGRLKDGAYQGIGRFRRVLVPVEPGTFDLPPLELVTFSPSRGEYVTHKVALGTLIATPGREGSGEVESFAVEGPAPSPEETVELAEPWSWGLATTPRVGLVVPLLLAGAAAPGGAVLVGQLMARLRRRWRERQEAASGPPSPFRHLRGLSDDPVARLQAYDAAIRQALANRVGVPVGALDREAVVATLAPDRAAAVKAVTARIDRARYGERSADLDLEAEVRRVVTSLEKP